jgi:hypothetical protein
LPLIAIGAEVFGERISVLRFPCPRPSADEKRDGHGTFHLHAGSNYRHELHEHYEWGDLKANPSKLFEKYFDAFVYVANWGTRELHIRLPPGSIDYKLLKAMVPGESQRLQKTGTFVIVEFGFESGWDGEDDGTRWMASLMPLRSDLLRGDLRCLYLGWLRSAPDGGLDEDNLEPPVLAGLKVLSGPLHALIEFLEIDEDLIEVAAQASKPLAAGPSRRELTTWIRGLPEKDKNGLLITAAVDQDERWRSDLVRSFRRTNSQQASDVLAASERRKAGDLLAAAHAREGESPAAERTAHSGSGKTQGGRPGKPGAVSRSIGTTPTGNLETGCGACPDAAAQRLRQSGQFANRPA